MNDVPDKSKYRRVSNVDAEPLSPSSLRIQSNGKIAGFIASATALLEEPAGEVRIVGRGRAISRAVTVAEILRRKIEGLHQSTGLSSVRIIDEFEPVEEGLEVSLQATSG